MRRAPAVRVPAPPGYGGAVSYMAPAAHRADYERMVAGYSRMANRNRRRGRRGLIHACLNVGLVACLVAYLRTLGPTWQDPGWQVFWGIESVLCSGAVVSGALAAYYSVRQVMVARTARRTGDAMQRYLDGTATPEDLQAMTGN